MKKLIIIGWNNIDWIKIQKIVFKWQQAIYSASKSGDIRLVRKLQKRLVNSPSAKLLAVRRITQDNRGKATACVDKVKILVPSKRFTLAQQLKLPIKSSPFRRVWIHKPATNEKGPLEIPTIKDRCTQALVKLALEPEWEARFEPNSYGFRPGRKCQDAVKAIYDCLVKGSKYVLDADIAKCFDQINHDALIRKIGMKGAFARQIKYWLKAGVLDSNIFQHPQSRTPQGEVISPLLANIALHGLETHLKTWASTRKIKYNSGKPIKTNHRADSLQMIRYANDFIVLHPDRQVILDCKAVIKEFLAEIGLELSKAKTRVTHSLKLDPVNDTTELGFDGIVGFNFLGFTFKQYKTQHKSAKSTSGKHLSYKTLIYPSTKSVAKQNKKLHELILKQGKTLNQKTLIQKLNPIIRGWASYFGTSHANTTRHLIRQDYTLYLKLRQWAKRKSGTSGKGAKFWRRVENNKWEFGTGTIKLLQHRNYSNPINKFVKVRSENSPFGSEQL
uniref:putative reverse transcriptase/maturase n=1 Tax=Glaucosphaera vacuolata TaxID=38265 RepID=UPI001FCD8D20|nr:putative reverse transcriptase/maturase [Glaucosphaera vacuolata]UNJ18715.1 putative reverse transcriptase/maturase [Glaucosphaera vacuolata]